MPTAGHDTSRGYADNDGNQRLALVSVTAAGSAQANAASLSAGFNVVASADGTKGVVLYSDPVGSLCIVANNANAILNIYPHSGGKIDNGSTDAAATVAAYSTTYMVGGSTTQWWKK